MNDKIKTLTFAMRMNKPEPLQGFVPIQAIDDWETAVLSLARMLLAIETPFSPNAFCRECGIEQRMFSE